MNNMKKQGKDNERKTISSEDYHNFLVLCFLLLLCINFINKER